MGAFFEAVKNGIVMLMYLPITFFSLYKGVMAIQGALNYQRGTNAVSRFVRDVKSNSASRGAVIWGVLQTCMGTISALLMGITLLTCLMPLPGIIMIVASFVIQNKQNNNAKRVEDARVVAKGSLDVAGAVAKPVGLAAGVAAGVVAAPVVASAGLTGAAATVAVGGTALAAKGVTQGLLKSAESASGMMTDVKALDVDETKEFADVTRFTDNLQAATEGIVNQALEHVTAKLTMEPTDFISQANNLGIKGNTVEEVGQEALKSPVMLTLLKESNQEPTVENVIPFVERALAAAK